MATPEQIEMAAAYLQLGIANAEHVESYLGDTEAAQLALSLAEKRGAFPTAAAGADEAMKARLAKIASGALCRGLTTPALLGAAFAAWPDGVEVVEIAVGLARKQLAKEHRRPPWEPVPPRTSLIERDPTTGAAMGAFGGAAPPVLTPDEIESRRQTNLLACSRGTHTYGEVDPASGWSTCKSCGHVLVADRRFGPGSPRPGPSGAFTPPTMPGGPARHTPNHRYHGID